MTYYYFTSESVTDGHPDKICDQISDAFLDAALRQDPDAHMAVEATIKDQTVFIYGEAETSANLNYGEIAKGVLKDIGYLEDFEIIQRVSRQSSEINQAVKQTEVNAGDQGIMFGYACEETPELMPLPIVLAHRLAYELKQLRQENPLIKPDGKTQVTVAYDDEGMPAFVKNIVVSTQHDASLSQAELRIIILKDVIYKVIDPKMITDETEIFVNPSGSFILGGPFGDSGTTGRKIVVDTYGGVGRIGGGCFSSKDPSKVDRSAAYYARYVAKNVVANGLAGKCEIQLSYAIGQSQPQSVWVETFNTGKLKAWQIKEIILKNFDFSVQNMIDELGLKRPIYQETATFGHFGRDHYPWEQFKEIKY
ncbi:MAG TPA: methionine adenosyltransferase [Erysipelothrix sp.]|nr:methionine adenosyltransferase [Erysipelothrix sp.]